MTTGTDQDPKVGHYPLADEANKWGLYVEAFHRAWQEARALQTIEHRRQWCEPSFHVALNEFWYVLKDDDEFNAFYKPYANRSVDPAEMSLILGRAKDALSRRRRLWGWERLHQDPAPRILRPGR